jgi:hypothetical protein
MQIGDVLKYGSASTLIYKVAQYWLEEFLRDYEQVREKAPPDVKAEVSAIRKYVGSEADIDLTTRQYQKFVFRFERFLTENTAPNVELAQVFDGLKSHLTEIYSLAKFGVSDDIRDWHDRILSLNSGRTIIAPD